MMSVGLSPDGTPRMLGFGRWLQPLPSMASRPPPSSPPAPHLDEAIRHIGRLRREQPQHGLGDLLGLAAAPQRHQMDQLLDPIPLARGAVDLGLDQARAHGIDADAVRAELEGEAVREGVDGALAGAITAPCRGRVGF
jgi:hypothetical protein